MVFVLKIIHYALFGGCIVGGIIGLVDVVMHYGSGTGVIIVPSIFIIIMGVLGIITTYNDFNKPKK